MFSENYTQETFPSELLLLFASYKNRLFPGEPFIAEGLFQRKKAIKPHDRLVLVR